ncbi:MAG: hypothetical protein U1E46_13110 [Hyphomicrobiales bacterium]
MIFATSTARGVAALAALAALPASALAQTAQTAAPVIEAQARMPIPAGDVKVKGCWWSSVLYGRYRIKFCLNGGEDGSYRVEGAGLTCKGDLDWFRNGREVRVLLNRGRCNGATDWSRDKFNCMVDVYGSVPGALVEQAQAQPQMRMPTPAMPMPGPGYSEYADRMSCVYMPSKGPWTNTRFNARRAN